MIEELIEKNSNHAKYKRNKMQAKVIFCSNNRIEYLLGLAVRFVLFFYRVVRLIWMLLVSIL